MKEDFRYIKVRIDIEPFVVMVKAYYYNKKFNSISTRKESTFEIPGDGDLRESIRRTLEREICYRAFSIPSFKDYLNDCVIHGIRERNWEEQG